MIKEPKNVDFVTTGRELTEEDFARISECIRQEKQRAKCQAARSATDASATTRQSNQ